MEKTTQNISTFSSPDHYPKGLDGKPEPKGMKKIIRYLTDFFKYDCNYTFLILLMLMVGVAVCINFDLVPFIVKKYGSLSEDNIIKADPDEYRRLLKYLGLYFSVFGGAFALQAIVDYKDTRLRDLKLWLLIVFGVILFAVRAWYRHPVWITSHVDIYYYTLVYKIIVNLSGLVLLCIPCFIYWWFVDRGRENYYGFTAKGVVLWPYFVLILLMIPLLLWAGTQPDFQQTYPRANHLYLQPNKPYYVTGTILYEICYSIDYGVTEFFFRGFLIIAFARFVGPKAILPMCAFYVAIHFDKPLGEAISSFFGGMILGIVAYRTRSIYGGIIVHLGIALLMELVGWIHLIK